MRLFYNILALALLVFLTSCTIQEVVLYKTSNYPAVAITPSGRIGPS